MNFLEERLGQVGEKFSDIGQRIEYIKTWDLSDHVTEIEQLCEEIQEATKEMRLILAMMKE